jgi:phage tail-like protein
MMSVTASRPAEGSSIELRPAGYLQESRYMRYLPELYQKDGRGAFLNNFLLIFESVLGPIERLVDNLPLYTEPDYIPREFLPWLAHWVAVSLDSAWSIESQRALIANAVEIYRWRGTRRGLKLHIAAYTGVQPMIQEEREGFILGNESALGWSTRLTTSARRPMHFYVTVPVSRPEDMSERVLRAIIDEDKPAHASYELRLVTCSPEVARSGPRSVA